MRTESYFQKDLGGFLVRSRPRSPVKKYNQWWSGFLEQDFLNGHKEQLVYL